MIRNVLTDVDIGVFPFIDFQSLNPVREKYRKVKCSEPRLKTGYWNLKRIYLIIKPK